MLAEHAAIVCRCDVGDVVVDGSTLWLTVAVVEDVTDALAVWGDGEDVVVRAGGVSWYDGNSGCGYSRCCGGALSLRDDIGLSH